RLEATRGAPSRKPIPRSSPRAPVQPRSLRTAKKSRGSQTLRGCSATAGFSSRCTTPSGASVSSSRSTIRRRGVRPAGSKDGSEDPIELVPGRVFQGDFSRAFAIAHFHARPDLSLEPHLDIAHVCALLLRLLAFPFR